MNYKRKTLLLTFFLLVNIFIVRPDFTQSNPPIVTLDFVTHGHAAGFPTFDFYSMIGKQLSNIGINVEFRNFPDMMDFYAEVLNHNFDLTQLGFALPSIKDPDYQSSMYSENDILNIFGYNTSMDWDNGLGTGKNEWFIQEGMKLFPPYSNERIEHYWNWENYLMDKICPILPLFSLKYYYFCWSNLLGYNPNNGLLQSWGKLSWNGTHFGQKTNEEIVLGGYGWTDLNPIFSWGFSEEIIQEMCLDPLVWFDSNTSIWPHVAKRFEYINDTTIEIELREGIKWQNDPDGNFTNEYLDIKDVYFTYYCWKNISEIDDLNWIKEMTILDNMSMRLYLDNDNETIGNQYVYDSLNSLNKLILPEYYLNQTQLADGITPDINHTSWDLYSLNCFGTGLFKLENFTSNETLLSIRPESWWLNTSITNDPALNWQERFGDFSSNINHLRINEELKDKRIDFETGKQDIIEWRYLRDEKLTSFLSNSNFTSQFTLYPTNIFLGFNMRENHGILGSLEPCPKDSSITIGLAIRKAICYTIDKTALINTHLGGHAVNNYWPIDQTLQIWCNPNIIKYDYNLSKAKEYLYKTGYYVKDYYPCDSTTTTIIIGLNNLFLITIFPIIIKVIFHVKRKSNIKY